MSIEYGRIQINYWKKLKIKTMKKGPNKRQAMKWIKALRSGEYEQGYGQLETHDHKFCCLGVACKIFIPEGKQVRLYGILKGGMPTSQTYAPNWLQTVNSEIACLNQFGYGLSNYNDGCGYTFDEIADIIQLVYVEGAFNE
jgi:hypothetical protein